MIPPSRKKKIRDKRINREIERVSEWMKIGWMDVTESEADWRLDEVQTTAASVGARVYPDAPSLSPASEEEETLLFYISSCVCLISPLVSFLTLELYRNCIVLRPIRMPRQDGHGVVLTSCMHPHRCRLFLTRFEYFWLAVCFVDLL